MMSPQLEDIVRKVRSDERIAPAEALVLWHEAPLWLLGELAARRKERVSGDKVYFNRNFHIEPTNLCVFNCNFVPTAVRREVPRRGTTPWKRSNGSPATTPDRA